MESEEKKNNKPMTTRDSAKLTKSPFLNYVIDCSIPVGDKIMDISAFETFLIERIKVKGRTGIYYN